MSREAYCITCFSKNHRSSLCTFISEDNFRVLKRLRDSNFKQLLTCTSRTKDRTCHVDFRNKNHSYQRDTFKETKVSATARENSLLPQQPALEIENDRTKGLFYVPQTIESLTSRHQHWGHHRRLTKPQRVNKLQKVNIDKVKGLTPPSQNLFGKNRPTQASPKWSGTVWKHRIQDMHVCLYIIAWDDSALRFVTHGWWLKPCQ